MAREVGSRLVERATGPEFPSGVRAEPIRLPSGNRVPSMRIEDFSVSGRNLPGRSAHGKGNAEVPTLRGLGVVVGKVGGLYFLG